MLLTEKRPALSAYPDIDKHRVSSLHVATIQIQCKLSTHTAGIYLRSYVQTALLKELSQIIGAAVSPLRERLDSPAWAP